MRRFACLILVLSASLSGCKSARQGLVLSVETQVFKQELADHPTTLRVEYRFGDPLTPAGNPYRKEHSAVR